MVYNRVVYSSKLCENPESSFLLIYFYFSLRKKVSSSSGFNYNGTFNIAVTCSFKLKLFNFKGDFIFNFLLCHPRDCTLKMPQALSCVVAYTCGNHFVSAPLPSRGDAMSVLIFINLIY